MQAERRTANVWIALTACTITDDHKVAFNAFAFDYMK